jgi:hypothetical protein
MTPRKKTKIALDENRMSILGVQMLFGFQLQAPFQTMFDTLPKLAARDRDGLRPVDRRGRPADHAQRLSPHRYEAWRGRAAATQHHLADRYLVAAAGPGDRHRSVSVGDQVLGGLAGPLFGIGFCLVAFVFWYGIELVHLTKRTRPLSSDAGEESALEDRIDYVLTGRVMLPGVQALLGFQSIVILTESFDALPETSVLVHLGALAAIAISAVLLIAPAAHHPIVFGGEDAEEFRPIASAYLLAATVFLAIGMAADCYVIVAKVLDSTTSGLVAAVVTAAVCLLWHIWPWMVRKR